MAQDRWSIRSLFHASSSSICSSLPDDGCKRRAAAKAGDTLCEGEHFVQMLRAKQEEERKSGNADAIVIHPHFSSSWKLYNKKEERTSLRTISLILSYSERTLTHGHCSSLPCPESCQRIISFVTWIERRIEIEMITGWREWNDVIMKMSWMSGKEKRERIELHEWFNKLHRHTHKIYSLFLSFCVWPSHLGFTPIPLLIHFPFNCVQWTVSYPSV